MKIITTDNNPFVRLVGEVYLPCAESDEGAIANPNLGQESEQEFPDPPTSPMILSATAFNKFAASKLAGGGAAGMARFIEIMDDGRAAGGAAKFCVNQYDKALTFAKSEVLAFGNVLKNAGCMSQNEVDAIAGDDWPVA